MAQESVSVAMGRPYKKALTANANSASFPSKVPTTAEPTNDGVLDLLGGIQGGTVPARILVLPYGLGSNNDVFDMKVIGWRHIGAGPPQATPLWVPTTLGEFTCTISSTAPGVTGAPVIATEFFADTITAKSIALVPKKPGYDATPAATFQTDLVVYSPADDTVGWILLPLAGFEKVEFTFDQTTGTPTTNCLVSFV